MKNNAVLSRRDMLKTGAGSVAGLAASGCGIFGKKRPNLIVVMSDQQRRQALGFMNEDPVTTPNLDWFATQSFVCTDAVTASPSGAPYRATLMTGRYPSSTGVTGNEMGLGLDEVTVSQSLKDAGYRTGFIGKWYLYDNGITDTPTWHFGDMGQFVPRDHRFGFDYWHASNCNHRAFHLLYYEDDQAPVINSEGWQPEHDIDTAISFIERHGTSSEPFALFISMVPPHNTYGSGFSRHEVFPGEEQLPSLYHTQYHAPEDYEKPYNNMKFKRRKNVAGNFWAGALPGYFGACNAVDDQFGRLLRSLSDQGIYDDTIIAYTSDHGEMMGSHNRKGKGVWYEESVGIPFFVRWPDHIVPQQNDVLFNSVDVMPTLLGTLGIEVPGTVEGTDYSRLLFGKDMTKPDSALIGYGNWRALRTPRYTFVARKIPVLDKPDMFMFDNERDPYQMKPLREGESGREFIALREELWDWLARTGDDFGKAV